MKDVYKQRVYDTLDSIAQRAKVIREMLNGERPPKPEDAKIYLKELERGIETIREIIDIS